MSLDILMRMFCVLARSLASPLSLVRVLNRSQMLTRENSSMPFLSVNSVGFADVCTYRYIYMPCLLRFDEIFLLHRSLR